MADNDIHRPASGPVKTREDVAIEWVLGEIGETLTELRSIKRRTGELDAALKESANRLERAAKIFSDHATAMIAEFQEAERQAVESRLTFAKNFSQYGSDLSAKIMRVAVLGSLGGGIVGGLIVLAAWYITHR